MAETDSQGTHFDVGAGCQSPWTGILGGVVFLGSIFAYLSFKMKVDVSGGPSITGCFSLFPFTIAPTTLPRDFFNVFGCLALAFLSMVAWELLPQRAYQWAIIGGCSIGLAGTWMAAGDPPWFWPEITKAALGWHWTIFETACAIQAIILCLILSLGIFRRAQKGEFGRPAPLKRTFITAGLRWVCGGILFLALILGIKGLARLESDFDPLVAAAWGYLFQGYCFIGFPYALVTNALFYGFSGNRLDLGFMGLLLCRRCARSFLRKERRPLRPFLTHRFFGLLARDYAVKIFFTSVMISFLFTCWKGLLQCIFFPFLRGQLDFSIRDFQAMACAALFLMDLALGLLGYISASKWLGNKSCSVDSTLLGCGTALICYSPFFGVAHKFFLYVFHQPGIGGLKVLSLEGVDHNIVAQMSEAFDVVTLVIQLLAIGIYAWATTAFGLRFSNLTHRGIVTRGPYSLVRHPAYAAKNAAWWFRFPWTTASIGDGSFLLFWTAVYYYRAITEEQHLSKDPAYLAYCQKVRYRFIPGIW